MQRLIRKILYRKSVVSYLLLPFSLIYIVLGFLNRKLYETGLKRSYQSNLKIISIGNIVSGGAGKTPFTLFLSNFLRDRGYKIAVSHRGYKGRFEHTTTLISDYHEIFDHARYAGDEPFLLSQKLRGIPVIVGKNRVDAIKMIEQAYPDTDFIILDDSFQNYKVKHDLDILIFNETGKIGNGFVLPAGILREPLSGIKRADLIIYTGNGVPDFLSDYTFKVLEGNFLASGVYSPNEKPLDIRFLKDKRIALLSGIGLPESFESTVSSLGISFYKHYAYNDHHNYTVQDLNKLRQDISKSKIELIITTEKDFSKLRFLNTEGISLSILKIEFGLTGEGKDILAQNITRL